MKIYKVVGLSKKLNVARTEDGARRLAHATTDIDRETVIVSLYILRDAPADAPALAIASSHASFRGIACDAIAWLGRFQPFASSK